MEPDKNNNCVNLRATAEGIQIILPDDLQGADQIEITKSRFGEFDTISNFHESTIDKVIKPNEVITDYFVEPGVQYGYRVAFYTGNYCNRKRIFSLDKTYIVAPAKCAGNLKFSTLPVLEKDTSTNNMIIKTAPILAAHKNITAGDSLRLFAEYSANKDYGERVVSVEMTDTNNGDKVDLTKCFHLGYTYYNEPAYFSDIRIAFKKDNLNYTMRYDRENKFSIPAEITVVENK